MIFNFPPLLYIVWGVIQVSIHLIRFNHSICMMGGVAGVGPPEIHPGSVDLHVLLKTYFPSCCRGKILYGAANLIGVWAPAKSEPQTDFINFFLNRNTFNTNTRFLTPPAVGNSSIHEFQLKKQGGWKPLVQWLCCLQRRGAISR